MRGHADADQLVGSHVEPHQHVDVAAIALAGGLHGHGLQLAILDGRKNSDGFSLATRLGQGLAIRDGIVGAARKICFKAGP